MLASLPHTRIAQLASELPGFFAVPGFPLIHFTLMLAFLFLNFSQEELVLLNQLVVHPF